jgi:glycine C-acetyltransferase
MKPYQAHLFEGEITTPGFLTLEPVFVYENKRYLNFLNPDCLYRKNNEYLRETAKTTIESEGITSTHSSLPDLQRTMSEIKRFESLLLFPDEISAFFAVFSICGPETIYFIDYETSASLNAVLQHRHIQYYNHTDLDQLANLMSTEKGKVIVIDGLYEWIGSIGLANDLMKIARNNECITIANEINSFGLLGRDGRGFIDLYNLYDQINIEVGSFSKFLGGFGCYVGAKKYLINKIKENISDIHTPLPQFMVAVNCVALEFIKQGKLSKNITEKLWKHSRYCISCLKQLGFKTSSETPIIVISFNNDEEAGEIKKRLLREQVIVAQNKERIRLCLSVEHSKDDVDYCIGKFELIGNELGIIHQ